MKDHFKQDSPEIIEARKLVQEQNDALRSELWAKQEKLATEYLKLATFQVGDILAVNYSKSPVNSRLKQHHAVIKVSVMYASTPWFTYHYVIQGMDDQSESFLHPEDKPILVAKAADRVWHPVKFNKGDEVAFMDEEERIKGVVRFGYELIETYLVRTNTCELYLKADELTLLKANPNIEVIEVQDSEETGW